jgi:uncharacterized protein YggT (Ycf19 family)
MIARFICFCFSWVAIISLLNWTQQKQKQIKQAIISLLDWTHEKIKKIKRAIVSLLNWTKQKQIQIKQAIMFSWEERWLLVLFVFCFWWVQLRREMIARFICFCFCWVQSRREMIACFICFCFWLSSFEKRDDCSFYLNKTSNRLSSQLN